MGAATVVGGRRTSRHPGRLTRHHGCPAPRRRPTGTPRGSGRRRPTPRPASGNSQGRADKALASTNNRSNRAANTTAQSHGSQAQSRSAAGSSLWARRPGARGRPASARPRRRRSRRWAPAPVIPPRTATPTAPGPGPARYRAYGYGRGYRNRYYGGRLRLRPVAGQQPRDRRRGCGRCMRASRGSITITRATASGRCTRSRWRSASSRTGRWATSGAGFASGMNNNGHGHGDAAEGMGGSVTRRRPDAAASR